MTLRDPSRWWLPCTMTSRIEMTLESPLGSSFFACEANSRPDSAGLHSQLPGCRACLVPGEGVSLQDRTNSLGKLRYSLDMSLDIAPPC